jgi:hypothetical protein
MRRTDRSSGVSRISAALGIIQVLNHESDAKKNFPSLLAIVSML